MASYGYLPVPLVYTQVVHLAVYVYFAASLVGEQWIIWKQEGDEEARESERIQRGNEGGGNGTERRKELGTEVKREENEE